MPPLGFIHLPFFAAIPFLIWFLWYMTRTPKGVDSEHPYKNQGSFWFKLTERLHTHVCPVCGESNSCWLPHTAERDYSKPVSCGEFDRAHSVQATPATRKK